MYKNAKKWILRGALQSFKIKVKDVVLVGHTVPMVTCCVKKMITMCSSTIGQFFDNMIVASTDKEWLRAY